MTRPKIKDDFLDKFSSAMFAYIIWFLLFLTFVLIIFYRNHEYIYLILDNLYISPEIINYISSNLKIIIPSLIFYFIFLWYIKEKKWLIFQWSWDDKTNTKYANILLLIYQTLNFFLIVFVFYLIDKNTFDFFNYFQKYSIIWFYLVTNLFFLEYKTFKWLIKWKFLKYIYLLLWISFIVISFFNTWYLEIFFIILISWIIVPITYKLNQSYIENIKNIDVLELFNKKWKQDLKVIVNEIKEAWDISNFNMVILFYTLLPTFILFAFITAFLLPIIGYIYSFNILTIIYLHLSFIVIYISLNLISNIFWEYATVKFDWKEHKWYLIENNKDKIILLNKIDTYVVKQDNVEFIKIKNKK